MEIFKDAEGREWTIKITISTVKELRATCDIDIMEHSGESIRGLGTDPCLLADVLYVCCKKEAEEKGISDTQFGEGLRGDVIDSATEAFLNELVNFFPSSKSQLMKKTLEKSKNLQAQAYKKAEEQIESLSLEELMKSQES